VVADTRAYLASKPLPSTFIPQAQVPDAVNALNVGLTPIAWVVHTRSDPGRMVPVIQEQLRQAIGLPVTDARVMTEVLRSSTSRERFNMWLMTVFAGSALLLAAIGIYGASFLYGVEAWDPIAFTTVPFLIVTVALIAVWQPAMRASRVDPIVALRYE
jgi:putative ABC transport system permease protein